MPTITRRGSGTPVTSGTTWTVTTNAVDGTPPANPATYALWTNAANGGVGYIETSGYNFASVIPAGSTINSVTVTIRHLVNNTGRVSTIRYQPYDGVTAIGSIATGTNTTSAHDDATGFSPTLAQLLSSTFKIRTTITHAANTQSLVFSLDHADVTVDYTPPPGPQIFWAAPAAITAMQTAHVFSLGSPGWAAGDGIVLVSCFSQVGADELYTITDPAGYEILKKRQWQVGGQNRQNTGIFAKVAAGTENGTTVALTTSAAVSGVCYVGRIPADSWAKNVSGIFVAPTNVEAEAANPDPPSITVPWGPADSLAVAIMTSEDSDFFATAPPSGYTLITPANIADGTEDAVISLATKSITGATEDPAAFTATSEKYQGFTMVIQPVVSLTAVGKDLGLVWDDRAALGDPSVLRWDILAPLGDPAVFRWDILTPVGDQTQTLWDIRAPIGDQAQALWDVKVPVGKSIGLVWDVEFGVSVSPHFVLSLSANVPASGANTTAQLTPPAGKTTGDFGGGRVQDDENPTDIIDVGADEYREDEWSIEATLDAEDSGEYEFRVLLDGESLDAYPFTPQVTLAVGEVPVGKDLGLVWDDRFALADPITVRWDQFIFLGDPIDLRWDLRFAQGDTATLRWDIFSRVTDQTALLWDIRAALADTTALRWDIFTPTFDSITYRWDQFVKAGDQADFRWDARFALADTVALRWDQFVVGADQVGLRWDLRFALGDPLGLRWDQFTSSFDVVALRWDQFTRLGDPIGLLWDLRARVTDSIVLRWDQFVVGGDQASLRWDITFALGDTATLRWDIFNPLGDPVSFRWDQFTKAGDTTQLVWDLRAWSGDTLALLWDVVSETTISKQASLFWDVRAALGDPLVLRWDQFTKVTKQAGLLWDIRLMGGDQVTARWDITLRVSDTAQLVWDTKRMGGDQVSFLWDQRFALADLATLRWDTLSAGGVGDTLSLLWDLTLGLGDTATLRWDIRTKTADQVGLLWDDRARVTDQANLLWDVRARVTDLNVLSWDIRTRVTDQVGVRWDTFTTGADQISPRWDVRARAGDGVNLVWDLLGAGVGGVVNARWDILGTTGDVLGLEWGIRLKSGDSISLLWDLIGPFAKPLVIRWGVGGRAFETLVLRWDVKTFLDFESDIWMSRAFDAGLSIIELATTTLILEGAFNVTLVFPHNSRNFKVGESIKIVARVAESGTKKPTDPDDVILHDLWRNTTPTGVFIPVDFTRVAKGDYFYLIEADDSAAMTPGVWNLIVHLVEGSEMSIETDQFNLQPVV